MIKVRNAARHWLFLALATIALVFPGCGGGGGGGGGSSSGGSQGGSLSIQTKALPTGSAEATYASTQLTARGGSGEYRWEVAENGNGLPPGMQLGSDGMLTGTPEETGLEGWVLEVQAEDIMTGERRSQTLALRINDPSAGVRTSSNIPPVAVADHRVSLVAEPVYVDLTANDLDKDGDKLSVEINQVAPASATVKNHKDGSVTVTPRAGFAGRVAVEYTLTDGRGGKDSNTAFVKYEREALPPGDNPLPPIWLHVDVVDSQIGYPGDPVSGLHRFPRFSAVYRDRDASFLAPQVQVQLSVDPTFPSDNRWTSPRRDIGRSLTVGDRCPDIHYDGPALIRSTRYYWRIRFFRDSDHVGLWSREKASFVTDLPNTRSGRPTDLYVSDSSAQRGSTGNPLSLRTESPVFSARYQDADSWDFATAYQIQVSTKADFTTRHWDSGRKSLSSRLSPGTRSEDIPYAGPSLVPGVKYFWRIFFYDLDNMRSLVSAEQSSFKTPVTNRAPAAPSQLFVHSTNAQSGSAGNPVQGIDRTPVFSAKFTDPDTGDTGVRAVIHVARDSAFANMVWHSGQFQLSAPVANGGRSVNVPYGGPALAYSTRYFWRMRFWDQKGQHGNLSGNTNSFVTVAAPVVNTGPGRPSNLFVGSNSAQAGTAGNPVNNISLTPKLSAIFNDANSGDAATHYAINVATDSGFSSFVWTSGKRSFGSQISVGTRTPDIAYAGPALQHSTRYFWRVFLYDKAGLRSPASSETRSFVTIAAPIVNRAPYAPTRLFVGSSSAQSGTQGTLVENISKTPKFSAIFNDPDAGDVATHYKIHVSRDSAFSQLVWGSAKRALSAPVARGARSADIPYAGPTLYFATRYFWRIYFFDQDGKQSAVSAGTNSFKTVPSNRAPLAPIALQVHSSNAQAGTQGSTVYGVDATPVFSAVHQDPDGDAASHYRLQIALDSEFKNLVWGSGQRSLGTSVASGQRTPNLIYPGPQLESGIRYFWRIVFWDARGKRGADSTGVHSFTSETAAGSWSFDESSLTTILDSSSRNRNATGINLASGPGRFGRSAVFTSGDRIKLRAEVLNNAQNVSVSLWFKTSRTGPQALISGANAGNSNEFLLMLSNATTITYFFGRGGNSSVAWSVPNSFADNAWHHLVLRRRGYGSSDWVDVVLDGVSLGRKTPEMEALDIASNGLYVGQEQDVVGGGFQATQEFRGALDELRIFRRILTDAQVRNLHRPRDPHVYKIAGAVFTPTAQSQTRTIRIPVDNNRVFRRIRMEFDVKHGGWNASDATLHHGLATLNRDGRFYSHTVGQLSLRGPGMNQMKQLSNLGLPTGQNMAVLGHARPNKGDLLHVAMVYSADENKVTTTLTRGGALISTTETTATVSEIQTVGGEYKLTFGFEQNGNSAASLGWNYSNLEVVFIQ